VSDRDGYDIVILGGGSGGYACALRAAELGKRVALIEKDKVGGTCLHRGCIPAKEFLETAHVMRTVAGAKEFGVQAEQPTVDFSVSQGRKQKVVETLFKGLVGLMGARGITTFNGSGELLPDRVVRVTGADQTVDLRGANVVLAPGSVPRTIPGFAVDGRLVHTSDEVLSFNSAPASVAIIGVKSFRSSSIPIM